ncbi:hemolysin III family protein [Reinekea marina]|uniref:Hemolysin III family protein n=1 Tax=Reinekea marina TaxID=1310421 RepID=A0ABV7WTE0_9GAMM|nr:hemolysin III family protein [Reinekea marina]MBU2862557.1 hemolysin III family protein [Reinekea forsetii]MDN3648779.1 hemolysin III family protein [Reinekea marina]
MSTQLPVYSTREEQANTITHAIGLLCAICASVWMMLQALSVREVMYVASATIYGATLIFMFLSSTLYHAAQQPSRRALFRQLDHLAILYLIAGSYTPYTLITLSGAWGWTIFGIVWGLTLVGTVLQFTSARHIKGLMVGLYLLMGWTVIIAIKPLMANLATGGLVLLVAGGVAYTLGVVFYVNKRIPYNHAIWHLFVLAGAMGHYLSVALYVL